MSKSANARPGILGKNYVHWDDLPFKKQIERWENVVRVLEELTPAQRKREFDMGSFGIASPKCLTSACAAGWCGTDPWFRRQGYIWNFSFDKEDALRHYDSLAELTPDDYDSYTVSRNNVELEDFFGNEYPFMNTTRRPVEQVIWEVKKAICDLHIDHIQEA